MNDIPTPSEFLSYTRQPNEKLFEMATVKAIFTSGKAKIQFDSDTAVSEKEYVQLSSYIPTINDRVLTVNVKGVFVILGKII